MRDGDVLDVERSDLKPLTGRDLVQLDLGRTRFGEPAGLEKAEREAGRVDRRTQARPHLDERADMILMGVGNEDSEQVLPLLLDEAKIGIDQIDAGEMLLAAKSHAAIDEDPLSLALGTETVKGGIHSDLAETAERDEYQLL